MSTETTPADVATDLDCIRWYVECLDAVAFKRRAVAGLAEAEGSYNAAMKRLADRSTRPAEPAAPTVDTIAAFLHKDVEWPEHTYPAYTWPEVDGDTGQRDGGYVKIVPKYVVEEFRGIARRLLIAFRQEGAVSAEPAAPVAEAGDGEVAVSVAHLNIGYLYGIADALERTYPTRAGDIRQCAAQIIRGLNASASTLEACKVENAALTNYLERCENIRLEMADRLIEYEFNLQTCRNLRKADKRDLEKARADLRSYETTFNMMHETDAEKDVLAETSVREAT